MKKALTEIFVGARSLVTGMRITLGQFFKPTITVQYPHETLKMPARFRGHIELVRDPETGIAKCFVCKLCEKACPSDCITVEGVKPEGFKRKTVNFYKLDFTKCSLCGSCVEACRDSAIRFSREYNLAGVNKDEFIMDLFKRLQEEAARSGMKYEIENLKPPTPAKPAIAATPAVAAAPAVAATPATAPSNLPQSAPGPNPGAEKTQPSTVEAK